MLEGCGGSQVGRLAEEAELEAEPSAPSAPRNRSRACRLTLPLKQHQMHIFFCAAGGWETCWEGKEKIKHAAASRKHFRETERQQQHMTAVAPLWSVGTSGGRGAAGAAAGGDFIEMLYRSLSSLAERRRVQSATTALVQGFSLIL